MLAQVVVRDLYKERDLGRYTGELTELVDAHGVLALKLSPVRCVPVFCPLPEPVWEVFQTVRTVFEHSCLACHVTDCPA